VAAVGEVDLDGFLRLYDQAVGPVYGYLVRGCGGRRALAEDLTQETFLAAIAAARRGRDDQLTLPWLMVVARNKLVDHYRRSGREARSQSAAATARAGPRADETTGGASALLAGLPPAQRVALFLRYVDDLPVAEVARTLGRSVHATESLLARGRAALRRSDRGSEHD